MRPAALSLLLAACASQIPVEQQAAYFRCPGIIVDGASENLQRAGYITAWREGDLGVETRWTSFTIDRRGDRRTFFLRYVVEAANDGVTFQLFERSDDARGEAPWSKITNAQVEEPATRRLLEKLRGDVCGTDGLFFAATSTAG